MDIRQNHNLTQDLNGLTVYSHRQQSHHLIIFPAGAAASVFFYFKVRGYKKVNGKTIWTKYSKVKSVRVK
jgi:hypothetical protein